MLPFCSGSVVVAMSMEASSPFVLRYAAALGPNLSSCMCDFHMI